MTSPSSMSSDLHELTSSPVSSELHDSEDEQPTLDADIFLKPSSYMLPCDRVAVNGVSSGDDESTVSHVVLEESD